MLQINWKKTRSLAAAAVVGAASVFLFTSLATVSAQATKPSSATPTAKPAVEVRGLPDFTELVEQVGPSVVNIRTLEKVNHAMEPGGEADQQMQDFFRRFFGVPMPNMPRPGPRPKRALPDGEEQPHGIGSGFIMSADGFIMTNAHVVDDADEVVVTLTDKREFKAKIVGVDKRSDVAVVKISASGLPAVRVGDVSRLKVGEWVVAIGSPFNLENTVTAGIVSAKQRDTGELLPLIQTDVAINPGNSGGPLINMRGEVVGINSQIYSRSGGFMGISFAIPIDEAVRVADQLRAQGHVSRGRLGVQIGPVSKELAESLGLGQARGALVGAVQADTPAEKAGIEPGDVIVKFNGKDIEKASDLPLAVGNTKPGTASTVTVWRRGSAKELSLTVSEFEEPAKTASTESAKPQAEADTQALGLGVSNLSAAAKKELHVKGGVIVDHVSDAAARAGLREGDVILEVGNAEIANAKEFAAAAAKLEKSAIVRLLVRRDDVVRYVLIRPAH